MILSLCPKPVGTFCKLSHLLPAVLTGTHEGLCWGTNGGEQLGVRAWQRVGCGARRPPSGARGLPGDWARTGLISAGFARALSRQLENMAQADPGSYVPWAQDGTIQMGNAVFPWSAYLPPWPSVVFFVF